MSTIAYSVAVALIGTSAAVASQIAVIPDAPVESRVEVESNRAPGVAAYDFDKFTARSDEIAEIAAIDGVDKVERLQPIRTAALGQDDLRIIVRDAALSQKANRLAAAADVEQLENSDLDVTKDSSTPELSVVVPLPKARPAYAALDTRPTKSRKIVRRKPVSKRKTRKPFRVAEASTSRRSKLARRLRTRGWLIGAFR